MVTSTPPAGALPAGDKNADGRAWRSRCCIPTGGRFAPSAVALADIPGDYLRWIRAAASRFGLDWSVIAGIYSIESDFGRLRARRVRSGENFARAAGPGQFLAGTWERYGVDGDGVRDRYDPADAIPGTANLLCHNGAPADYPRAVFAYNHAGWYVADVFARRALPRRRRAPRRRPICRASQDAALVRFESDAAHVQDTSGGYVEGLTCLRSGAVSD